MQTVLLLIGSNVFMTYAWYGHLKALKGAPLYVAIGASWGIAFFEYCLQVPANRVGARTFGVTELKVLQEVISLGVFVPFAVFYMKQTLRLDHLWAAVCLIGAVYFAFRGKV